MKAGQSRLFFLVLELSGSAQVGDDFWARISALGVSGGTEVAGVPGELVECLTIGPNQPAMEIWRGGFIPNGGLDGVSGTEGTVSSLTYTIENVGLADLTLNLPVAAPTSQVNCTAAVVQQPASANLAPAASTNFVVEIVPAAPGAFSCTLSLNSNDPAGAYVWQISGNAIATAPNMVVSRAAAIINGGTDTLGSATSGSAQSVTYTIQNAGTATLNLTAAPNVIAGANVTAAVVSPPATTINAGGSTTFTIEYTPTTVGAFDFTVSIPNDDSANNPYTWTATGTAAAPGDGGSGGDGGGDSGGCSTGSRVGVILWPLLLALAMVLRLRRRRRA